MEMLSEFVRYERLVINVAKGLYKQRNWRRQRVPRGFASGFGLRLAAVKPGSVMPVLEISQSTESELFERESEGIFDEARFLIQDTLRSVADGGAIPPRFPHAALKEFSSFGRSLQDDEKIYFDEGSPHEATFSQEIRRILQERASIEQFEVEVHMLGQIIGVLADKSTFEFLPVGATRPILGRFSSAEFVPELTQHLGHSTMAPTVAMSAVALQTPDAGTIAFQDILSIEAALPAEWSSRLAELSKLEPGWLESGGEAIALQVLRATESLLLECLDASIPRPNIYPADGGAVQLEWVSTQGEVSVEIAPSREIELYAFSKVDDADETENVVNWADLESAVEFIARGIGKYVRGVA
ncbi:hypothetical protein ACIBBB_02700 [Streptomyces sp. NPDC051217]|uniref:hypothetical protein n=1 Tax=Streptomyces sp. NPDC051217 TaxID=3365644 RepID=UPI0037A4B552